MISYISVYATLIKLRFEIHDHMIFLAGTFFGGLSFFEFIFQAPILAIALGKESGFQNLVVNVIIVTLALTTLLVM